jgi:Ribosomal protein L7/L12 C-terminal domain
LVVLGLLLLAAIRLRLDAIQSRIGAVSRVEAKLNLLLKQANIKFDPYAHVSQDIIEALRADQKIKAIKLYREATGVGLKEAKDFIACQHDAAPPSVALDLPHTQETAPFKGSNESG